MSKENPWTELTDDMLKKTADQEAKDAQETKTGHPSKREEKKGDNEDVSMKSNEEEKKSHSKKQKKLYKRSEEPGFTGKPENWFNDEEF